MTISILWIPMKWKTGYQMSRSEGFICVWGGLRARWFSVGLVVLEEGVAFTFEIEVGFVFSFLRGRRNVAVERVDERVDVAFGGLLKAEKSQASALTAAKSYSRRGDGTLRANARSSQRHASARRISPQSNNSFPRCESSTTRKWTKRRWR